MRLLPPPGPERRRQLRLLGVMLAGLAAVVWYQWRPAEPAVPASNLPAAAVATVHAMTLPEPVKLADLDGAPAPTEIGRNPFGFGARPAPPAPAMTFAPVAAFPPAQTVPEGPPPITLRLMGMMVDPASKRTMVTLKDGGGEGLFHAFEGDVVDGRYRIVRIGLQSVVVSYVDGSGQRTIGFGN